MNGAEVQRMSSEPEGEMKRQQTGEHKLQVKWRRRMAEFCLAMRNLSRAGLELKALIEMHRGELPLVPPQFRDDVRKFAKLITRFAERADVWPE